MIGGFGRGSGPPSQGQGQGQAQAQAQTYLSPFGSYHTAPRSNEPTMRWGGGNANSLQDGDPKLYQSPVAFQPQAVSHRPRSLSPAKTVDFRHVKRTNSPYFPTPDETLKKSRNSTNIPMDVPFTDKSYMVPNQARSPPLVFQNNLYGGGHYPQTAGAQLRPSSSTIWGSTPTSPSHDIIPSAQDVIAPDSIREPGTLFQTKHADTPLSRQTRSPSLPSTGGIPHKDAVFYTNGHQRYLIDYRDLDAPEEMGPPSLAPESNSSHGKSSRPSGGTEKHSSSSTANINRSKYFINGTTSLVQGEIPLVSTTRGSYQSGTRLQIKDEDVLSLKSARFPTVPSAGVEFIQNPAIAFNDHRINPGHHNQNLSPTSGQNNGIGFGMDKQLPIPGARRSKMPLMSSSDQAFQEDMVNSEETERELQAKVKRLARFKDEMTRPVQSQSTERNQKFPTGSQRQPIYVKQNLSGESSMDVIGDSSGGNIPADYEGAVSSSSIVGLCPDMCPDSERAERERKGDLDQYERLDGDRNLSSEFLAVKKYNRTAEREAELIRPMPILQMTMDYLLDLLHKPYDHRFLGLYNFLWDRMRAIRMDLRMQHIFNLEAINMLEQMIRLHIIAMHELCEHMKGEGFHEGFDAHLNIEQMNKTSVELFQLYDDHRKKGICAPSEKEFRGYYALLKLDKHPGYKVEPAELSLDLAKMTREMRQTPEVLFARDVARACRTGNFVAFFRLASNASYLQACLMHAHFSKLRTQALASLHSGLQINQGIPISDVAKWLGMEEEVIGDLLEFYGFSVKEFEEPYLVKENTFINIDNEFPVKRSKLVERKRSSEIFNDVLSPSLSHFGEVKEIMLKKDPEPIHKPSHAGVALSTTSLDDQEMHDIVTISSPKSSTWKPIHETSVDVTLPDEKLGGHDAQMVPASLFALDLPSSIPVQHQNTVEYEKPKYDSSFRNSLGRSIKPDLEAVMPMPHISLEVGNENPFTLSLDSVIHTPRPHLAVTEGVEDVEQTVTVEEEESDEVAGSDYDREVAEAKLKLILRTWKRHAVKKRDLRVSKQLAANAALSLLSLGPPIWQSENRQCNFGAFNIDHVMSERHEIQEKSLSVWNPSDVVAAKLAEKNPDYKCLCWKLVLCIQEGTPQGHNIELQNKVTYSAACSWLRLKLLPEKSNNHGDLLLSCQGFSIWRSWSCGQSDADELCCLSVIKSSTFGDGDEPHSGASAVLFLFSENISLEFQKKQLHGIIMSLPSGSSLPLLILSDSGCDDFDPSTIAQILGLHQIDKSRVSKFHITFLREDNSKKIEGFFSDECLREGLEWLASESPPQVVLRETKTRELVLSHVNSTMVALDEINSQRLGPNDCILAFNEALDRSMEEVAAAARANPVGWPCSEIGLLEESSNEYRVASWFLPNIGWSSSSRTEVLMRAFTDCKLPPLEDDLSWLSRGIYTSDDFEKQKTRLESCLINYLTETSQMTGGPFSQKEAGVALQQFTRLELQNSAYYIIPNWESIFRRLFNWRLMNLTSREVSLTYVLAKNYFSGLSSESKDNYARKDVTFSSPCIIHPSLDELIEVGSVLSSNHVEDEAFWTVSSATAFDGPDLPTLKDSAIFVSDEDMNGQESILTSETSGTEETNNGVWLAPTTKSSKEADRLSELLDRCNIVQDKIDKKLSIYF